MRVCWSQMAITSPTPPSGLRCACLLTDPDPSRSGMHPSVPALHVKQLALPQQSDPPRPTHPYIPGRKAGHRQKFT